MEVINLKSNLGFVNNYSLNIAKIENGYKLSFSTGFSCEAIFLKKEGDVNIYTYKSKYNEEINYLHEREDNDIIYFQTVQSGLNPGGSTFNIKK